VQSGDARQGAQRARLAKSLCYGRRQRAAPDLDHDAVDAFARQLRGHLVPEGHAALDGQAVLVPLAGERQRAVGEGSLERVVGRVAGNAGVARGHDQVGLELLEPGHHDRVGVRGDEHLQPPARSPGHDGGGQRRVAARRDGERPADARGRLEQAGPFGHLEVDREAHEVPCLVRARHVAGLVLHPDAAVGLEPEGVRQVVLADERRDPEAVAVHLSHGVVEPPDDLHVRVVAEARVLRQVVRAEQPAVPQVGVLLGRVVGEPDALHVEAPDQDVVDVGAVTRVGTPERVGLVEPDHRPASGALHYAPCSLEHVGRHASVTSPRPSVR
jgi:hypothetical protein